MTLGRRAASLKGGYLLSHFRSTIGVVRFNFSVRNGKRWSPHAITTLMLPVRSGIYARLSATRRVRPPVCLKGRVSFVYWNRARVFVRFFRFFSQTRITDAVVSTPRRASQASGYIPFRLVRSWRLSPRSPSRLFRASGVTLLFPRKGFGLLVRLG